MTLLVRPDATNRPWAHSRGALPLQASSPARADASSPVTRRRLDRSIQHRFARPFWLVRKNVPDRPGTRTRPRSGACGKEARPARHEPRRRVRSAKHSEVVTAAPHGLDQRVQRRLIDVGLLAAVRWRRRALIGDGGRYSMPNTLQRLSP